MSRHLALRAAALVLAACDGAAAPVNDDRDVHPGGVQVALQEGPTVAFDVGIDAVYCAAAVRCEPALLDDPFTGERGPTLVLSFTCRTDDADPLDVFQTVARKMTCYDAGDPAEPASWAGGREVVPLREEVYSGLVSPWGDAQYTLAVLPLEARSAAFCAIEAWGVYDGAAAGTGRTVRHAASSPVVHWEVVVEATAADAIDCHLDDGIGGLRRGPAVSVTHTRARPPTSGSYPRTQSFAALVPTVTATTIGPDTFDIHALRVVYALDARFPVPAHAQADGFATRDLWFWEAGYDVPLDVRGGESCAMTDAAGELTGIAVEIVELPSERRLGAVIIADDLAGERFDCERDADGGCRIVRPEAWADAAPCLVH